MSRKIVIIGAGPSGLGAAYRLKERGHDNFVLYERNSYAGGLCASFKDEKGFTWDLGGHVIFSHYEYYDQLLKKILKGHYIEHERKAWIRTMDRWIPYPFQNNLRYLPKDIIEECLAGLKRANGVKKKPENFKEWIIDNLGEGIAKYFMLPYNFKVWAYPPDKMSYSWIAEKVSSVDLKEMIDDLGSGTDKIDWGPNARFKYPLYGGSGEMFRVIAEKLRGHITYNAEVLGVDPAAKTIELPDGGQDSYDILINTMPVNKLVNSLSRPEERLIRASLELEHNGIFVVGLGLKKPAADKRSWVYFPDANSPFYRATYFSAYSPHNVPDHSYSSFLCETAYSKSKPENRAELLDETVKGLINTGLIAGSDRGLIASTFTYDIEYGYPIPTLKRDEALNVIIGELEKKDIYSCGRFGGWRYEMGNTDQSVMQGKEVADKIL